MAAVIHPFAEHIAYYALFAIPLLTTAFTGTVSILGATLYVTYLDTMNNLGHCNFELIPKPLFDMFPPLKYIMYTPSYHSLHHTQFRTNYSLFMPFYDYIYGTMDKSTDALYEKSLIREEESPNVYQLEWQRQSINGLIEEAILEAEAKGVKVFTLGLLNQVKTSKVFRDEFLITWGEFSLEEPELTVKLVDGSSLAVAVVLNSIPRGTTQVVLRGNFNKVASYLALALCQRGIQVAISRESDYEMLKSQLKSADDHDKLVLSRTYSQKTWLVGDGLSKEEQTKASKGTLIIPYSQFPPKKVRKDCFYYTTPSMLTPKYLENVDSCENWLPRRVMSAWRIAGILHGLEGWNVNEYGNEIFNVDKVWEASLQHGFTPLMKAS
ncbi:protein eceriferum 1 [Tanacetum coccineum]|uniref:Protein eceriferum 1 n=1 Tax=Tanacetum coccineum TaxID=301880 RepID=A0ABQ5BD31_9ASTR